MASSIKMQHLYYAFPSEIISSNGDVNDFHSLELKIGNDILNMMNKNIVELGNSSQFYISYSFTEDEMKNIFIHHESKSSEIETIILMCNKTGLYANLTLRGERLHLFYFVKLIGYCK